MIYSSMNKQYCVLHLPDRLATDIYVRSGEFVYFSHELTPGANPLFNEVPVILIKRSTPN